MRLTKDLKTPHDDTTYADDLMNVVDKDNIVLTKLKHYEDIEEELGIDLITFYKNYKELLSIKGRNLRISIEEMEKELTMRRGAIMSKELTPLEVSKQLKDFVLEFTKNGLDRRFVIGSFDIIDKQLKALEIIKEKECLFRGLSETTQEEFDLLREVLSF
jgi:hypothetical protein